ncbi:MAG: hypothetical protein ABIW30_03690 [Arenimonas sp.]
MRINVIFATAVLVLASAPSMAGPPKALQDRLSPQQFHSFGLDKLSPAELAGLSDWMRTQVELPAPAPAPAPVAKLRRNNQGFLVGGDRSEVRSRFKGEFHGWDGRTAFPLENGQVWVQVDDATLDGLKRSHPMITISPSLLGGWRLYVEGSPNFAKVKRVK